MKNKIKKLLSIISLMGITLLSSCNKHDVIREHEQKSPIVITQMPKGHGIKMAFLSNRVQDDGTFSLSFSYEIEPVNVTTDELKVKLLYSGTNEEVNDYRYEFNKDNGNRATVFFKETDRQLTCYLFSDIYNVSTSFKIDTIKHIKRIHANQNNPRVDTQDSIYWVRYGPEYRANLWKASDFKETEFDYLKNPDISYFKYSLESNVVENWTYYFKGGSHVPTSWDWSNFGQTICDELDAGHFDKFFLDCLNARIYPDPIKFYNCEGVVDKVTFHKMLKTPRTKDKPLPFIRFYGGVQFESDMKLNLTSFENFDYIVPPAECFAGLPD